MDTPSWYAEIERDEAELDARIRERTRVIIAEVERDESGKLEAPLPGAVCTCNFNECKPCRAHPYLKQYPLPRGTTCGHQEVGICDDCLITRLDHWKALSAKEVARRCQLFAKIAPPRARCLVCGLEHREVCPSGPGVAEILSAPMPERFDPPCEGDE